MTCPTNQAAVSCTTFPTAAEARKSISCLDIVFSEIAALQQLILQAINGCESELLITSGTPLTDVTSISSVTVTAGGAGYFPVAATASITHPTGTGAVLSPVVTNGRITSIAVTSAGSGYAPIEAEATAPDGSGTAIFKVVVSSAGVIQFIHPLSGGADYEVGDELVITHPEGTGAVATVATVDGGGRITSVNVSDGGSGYAPVVATVSVSHPIGMGFAGTVNVISGAVTTISVTSTGFGYETLYPTLDIDTDNGSDASFTFTVNGSGTITAVAVAVGGIGYASGDTATVVTATGSSGTGATVTLNVSAGSTVDSIHYYKVWVGTETDDKALSQLTEITNYFKCLGYTIQLRSNPTTQKSLSWYIKW